MFRAAAVASAAVFVLLPVPAAYATDTTAPGPVTSLAALPGDGQVRLTWANPADADLAGVTVRVAAGTTPPASPADGTPVFDGLGTTTTAVGLTNGTAYAFAVFARDAAPNYSAAATVTATPVPAPAVTLSLAISPATVTYGGRISLTGALKRADNGAGISGETVEVYARRRGATGYARINTVRTGTGGAVSYSTIPGANGDYLLRHRATPYVGAADSPVRAVGVRPLLSGRLSAGVVDTRTRPVVYGRLTPAGASGAVYLQRYAAGRWHGVAVRTPRTDGTVDFVLGPLALGTYNYRLVVHANTSYATAATGTLRLSVVRPTLKAGDRGAAVYDVQRRLAALGYDVGAVNGVYGYDTVHAVIAFQKVNLLPRTGQVTTAVWNRLLGRPIAPVLREPRAGASVEIDLTRQTLYYARDGRVVRILDISSGSGQLFTVDGITERAVTPLGRFRIQRKINAWRISRLGGLYRPAYFVGGYAIHGSLSVPTYPASHGCIRITLPAMDRMYDSFRIGTPVLIYRG